MTLQEYLADVVPLLKEFKTFLKKNKYFISVEYGSLPEWSYPELQQAMHDKKEVSFKFDFTKDYSWESPQQRLDKNWGYDSGKDAPKEVIEKKNEYVSKLKDIFGEYFWKHSIGDSDVMKSNKRAIKSAIDQDIYKKLLDAGEVTADELKKIAESAGVKLPNKLFSASSLMREKISNEIASQMPPINREILMKLLTDIDKSFQPLADIVYVQETDRYNKLIKLVLEKPEVRGAWLSGAIPFYIDIFNIEKSWTIEVPTGRFFRGKETMERETMYSGFSLINGWEGVVKKEVLEYIELLKGKFMQSITQSFKQISLPIDNFEQLELHVGSKGFEGTYRFNFKNGSSFDYRTEAIGAGGYNIQIFHFRYLTKYNQATLADGTVLNTPSTNEIVKHFSDQKESEKIFNPYNRVEAATSVEELADAIYLYLKGAYNYSNVRKNAGKEDASVSFKLNRYGVGVRNNKYQHGIYFKRDQPIESNKAKAIVLLEEAKAEKPKFESGGETQKEEPPFQLNPQEIAILQAVYRSRMQGLIGSSEYLKGQHSGEYAMNHGQDPRSLVRDNDKEIEHIQDNMRFLTRYKYPWDITQEYEGKDFLRHLNDLVRTHEGRELFEEDRNPSWKEYYDTYLSLYDKLEAYYDDKFGEA